MGYAVLRMEKTSGTEAAMSAHIERTIKPKNADEFNIDGVSHVNWFKRKKDEFMETLGMPTKRQNRGINLLVNTKFVVYYITDFLYF